MPRAPLTTLRTAPTWGLAGLPTLHELWLTPSRGVTKMRPKMVLYMLNMLHMWSWENDTQPSEKAVGYVLTRT